MNNMYIFYNRMIHFHNSFLFHSYEYFNDLYSYLSYVIKSILEI